MITVALVDATLAQEILIAISDEDDPHPRQLSYQPASRKYTVWSFVPATQELISQRFDYVHNAVDCFNRKE